MLSTSLARAVEAVGIRNGPSYTQLRLGPDGPVVMEVAARLGGGHDAELCAAATGVDLNASPFAPRWASPLVTQCHEQLPPVASAPARTVVRSLPRATRRTARGRRGRRRGGAAVEALEWVRVYRRPGHVFGPLRRGADRAGAVLATGTDPRRGARAGSPGGGRRTLPGRCGRAVAPRSASSPPRSARRRSPRSRRRCARAG